MTGEFDLLAWTLFLNPIALPARSRLLTCLPLVFCVALVYRATRARSAAALPRAVLITFVNIVVGMTLIALAAYALHMLVLWLG
ncbi:MAG: hypothetical protein D6744_10845 [Planctomycetota bacterium]|nr:MAG: hypothetical protein D6744_10845 [Planctomycetota bacterium]